MEMNELKSEEEKNIWKSELVNFEKHKSLKSILVCKKTNKKNVSSVVGFHRFHLTRLVDEFYRSEVVVGIPPKMRSDTKHPENE